MEELKSCPFCKIIPDKKGCLVSHPPSRICGLSSMMFTEEHWNTRIPHATAHKCECNDGGSGKTVRRVNGLSICPRCGGICIPPATASKGVDVEKIDDLLAEFDVFCVTYVGDNVDSRRKILATAIKEAIEKGDV